MKKGLILAGFLGLVLVVGFAVKSQQEAPMYAPQGGQPVGTGGTPMYAPGVQPPAQTPRVQKTPAQEREEYIREILVWGPRVFFNQRFEVGRSKEELVKELNEKWQRVVGDLVKQVNDAILRFSGFPGQQLYDEIVKALTAAYWEQRKRIDSFKAFEAPKNPWEQ